MTTTDSFETSPVLIGAISVKKLMLNIAMDQQGRMMQQTHIAGPSRSIVVVPGKMARMMVTVGDKTTVVELPIPPLGWEYVTE